MRTLEPKRRTSAAPSRRLPAPQRLQAPHGCVQDGSRGAGRPLEAATRAYMEPRFARDFSRVQVHTDDAAGASARALGSLAYTAGEHLVFAPGHYRPHSDSGRALLAHELTHVVQQSEATAIQPRVGGPGGALERAAARNATDVVSRAAAPAADAGAAHAPAIQRVSDPDRELVFGTLGLNPNDSLEVGAPVGQQEVPRNLRDLMPAVDEMMLDPDEPAPRRREGPQPPPQLKIPRPTSAPRTPPKSSDDRSLRADFLRQAWSNVRLLLTDVVAPKVQAQIIDVPDKAGEAGRKGLEAAVDAAAGGKAPDPPPRDSLWERRKGLMEDGGSDRTIFPVDLAKVWEYLRRRRLPQRRKRQP